MTDLDSLREFYRNEGVPTVLEDSYKVLLENVRKANPQNILEIGTATGMSAIAMTLACPNCNLTTIEKRENSYLKAKQNFIDFGVAERVTALLGDSLDVIPSLTKKYDFVFLDGAKSKYKANLELLEKNLTAGATVVADNVLYRGYVEGNVPFVRRQKTIVVNMRNFLDYVFKTEKYQSTLYRVGDGVSVSVYKGEK